MPQPARPLNVLVVDDNADAADSLAALLRLHGHDARTAACGVDALAAADGSPPDAVVLDLRMPGLSGFDVAAALRRRAAGRPLLILAVTGLTSAADRGRSADAGVDDFLLKPADPHAILARLAAFGRSPGR